MNSQDFVDSSVWLLRSAVGLGALPRWNNVSFAVTLWSVSFVPFWFWLQLWTVLALNFPCYCYLFYYELEQEDSTRQIHFGILSRKCFLNVTEFMKSLIFNFILTSSCKLNYFSEIQTQSFLHLTKLEAVDLSFERGKTWNQKSESSLDSQL